MSLHRSNNPLFINTVILRGTPREKIAAAQTAGFDQIELWSPDLDGCEGDHEAFGNWIRKQSVSLAAFDVLRDFDGAADDRREGKRAEALMMLDMAVQLGAKTLLTTASSDAHCVARRVNDDMRWLAREANSRHLKIAYEAVAWSRVNYTLSSSWDLVRHLDEPNLGVAVDTFHIFARNCDARELAGIPMDRIFLVQLSDVHGDQIPDPEDDHYCENVIQVARHHRLLPGQGQLPIQTILYPLRESNYSGPIGIEVFNDDLQLLDPQIVARDALFSLQKVWFQ
jgi:4-hydroxyphenylpyruvate dioxygenase